MDKLIFFFFMYFFCFENCAPSLNTDKICDLSDPAKFIREALVWRTTTNQEFYCSLRIRDRANISGSNTGSGTGTGISTGTGTGTLQPTAPTISFAKTLYSGFQGEAYNIIPTLGGDPPTSCTISPALPTGLSINATTCAITGTATTGGAGASYTITATNAVGQATASTKIKVLGQNAFRVYAQNGSFGTNTLNIGSIGANGDKCLNTPRGVTVDANDNVYIADSGNNRVLFFTAGSTTATRVYGQAGFITGTPSAGTATSLNTPYGLTLDSQNNLYIIDHVNFRVLRYPPSVTPTTANLAYGQNGNLTGAAGPSVNQNLFNYPQGISIDSNNEIYISDNINNRVMFYSTNSPIATSVYGKAAGTLQWTCANVNTDNVTNTCSGAGITNSSGLSGPKGVISDATSVYVGDTGNNRILIFPKGSNVASIAIGQSGLTSNVATPPASCTSSTVGGITGLTFDSNGNLFASSDTYFRLMIFKPPFTMNMNATYILGQTSLTNFTTCATGIAANRIDKPMGNTAFDSFGNFYTSEESNHRVLVF